MHSNQAMHQNMLDYLLESCLERVIEIQIDQDSESGKWEFKAKEWDLWDAKTICTEKR